MKTIKLEVYGLVQGVGFRFMTKKLADELGVKGIVMNRNDGSVYIEAQADPMTLQQFISFRLPRAAASMMFVSMKLTMLHIKTFQLLINNREDIEIPIYFSYHSS